MIKNYNIPQINELLTALRENKEEIKTFDGVVGLNSYFNRHFVVGDIDQDVGEVVESYIRFYNQYDDEMGLEVEDRVPIVIFIDSYGGDLGACFTIIDAITMSKTPVYTVNMGSAYSAGFFIAIAGHKRFAYPHASYLYHEGSAGTQGTSVQFENFSAFYKKQLAQLREHTLAHTKISPEKYEEIKKDDFWMTANEALELGVCDAITTSLEVG